MNWYTLRAGAMTLMPMAVLDAVVAASVVGSAWRAARGSAGALLAFGALAPWLYVLLVRPWFRNWGASPAELLAALPGDDVLHTAADQTTRAVTIQAPVEEVWKWLVQIGQGRGGMHSYDWLENLAGADIDNAEETRPEVAACARRRRHPRRAGRAVWTNRRLAGRILGARTCSGARLRRQQSCRRRRCSPDSEC